MQNITVHWPDALVVFRGSTVIKYRSIARRAFGEKFDLLPPFTQDSLVSLVYNRGASKTGRSRLEIAIIADTCVPALDVECIAKNLEAMERIWKNSSIEVGMKRRRYAEAELARRGL
jgi:GH24 family phage-related lysozyme (muramidase)